MTKPTFEQCLDYIESTLRLRLLDWQKEYLHILYHYPQSYIIPARTNGKKVMIEAMKLLNKLLERRINYEGN